MKVEDYKERLRQLVVLELLHLIRHRMSEVVDCAIILASIVSYLP